MIRLDPKAIELAKSGIFAAFGSATKDGNKLQIEITDDQLQTAAEIALDYLAISVFGPDAHLKKD